MAHYSNSELASLRADSADADDVTEEEMDAAMAFTLGLTLEQYRTQRDAAAAAFLAKRKE